MQETEDAIPIVEFSRGILEWTEEKKRLWKLQRYKIYENNLGKVILFYLSYSHVYEFSEF